MKAGKGTSLSLHQRNSIRLRYHAEQIQVEAAHITLAHQAALKGHVVAVEGREDLPDAGDDMSAVERLLGGSERRSGGKGVDEAVVLQYGIRRYASS